MRGSRAAIGTARTGADVETRRIFLYLALGLILILIWVNWRSDHAPKPLKAAPAAATSVAANGAGAPAATNPQTTSESAKSPELSASAAPATGTHMRPAKLQAPGGTRIRIHTNVLVLNLALDGATLTRANLLKYPLKLHSKKSVALLSTAPKDYRVAEPLLISEDLPQTLHYQAGKTRYQLAPGAQTLSVPLSWKGDGVSVKRVFVFTRGSYAVRVKTTITNSTGVKRFTPGLRLVGHNPATGQHFWDHFFPKYWAYRGPSYYDGDYEKPSAASLSGKPLEKTFAGGWIASVNQYFVAAAIPAAKRKAHYFGRAVGDSGYAVGYRLPPVKLAAGQSKTLRMKLYLGPKTQGHLNQVAPGLSRTVDYGKATIISVPIFWILSHIEAVIGNWGWALILLVLLIKAVFYFPQRMSARSMAKMRKLQPRLKLLKERYKDDKQKLSQATMKLYKEEGANPVSGCLPMLIQLPIFFGLFYVLINSAELRLAPWVLWLQDLSAPDPLYILPILYALAMLVQFRLQPQAGDNAQAKMMMVMPLGMAFLYAVFPSGLVLYYLLNTILNILIQWQVNRELGVPLNLWPEDLWPRKKKTLPAKRESGE
ncbi:MAG: membrane protein insertase YidC [Gammaproteobacteria bacterium]